MSTEGGAPAPTANANPVPFGLVVTCLSAAAVVVVGIARLALGGWGGVAADDARYLFIGLSLLAGDGPVTAEGEVFLARSPAYPALLAVGARLVGGDPLAGAHVAASALLLAGLTGAVLLAARIAGPLRGPGITAGVGGLGAAAALLTTPLVWTLLPTLRVDLAQTAGIVATLLVFGDGRGTMRRAAFAGVVLGATILVKESALPLFVLPVAAFRRDDVRGWLRRAIAFLGAGVLTIAWWWIFVWQETGILFPLNAISGVETRDVPREVAVDAQAVALVGLAVFAWGVTALRGVRDPGARPLLLAGLLLSVPATYAFVNGLDARNYLAIAVLTSVAVGVALATVVDGAWARGRAPAAAGRVAVAGLAVVLGVLAVGSQATTRATNPERLPETIATWLEENGEPGDRLAMTFRYSSLLGVRLHGRTTVDELTAIRPRARAQAGDFVWLGLRDNQLFGYDRMDWAASLAAPATRWFLIVQPHPLVPDALLPGIRGPAAANAGLTGAEVLDDRGGTAEIWRVDPPVAGAYIRDLPLHLDAPAALAWLARHPADGARELGDAGAVVDTTDPTASDELLEALAGEACSRPAGDPYPAGWLRLARAQPDGTCPTASLTNA